jgi:hypothetical protein
MEGILTYVVDTVIILSLVHTEKIFIKKKKLKSESETLTDREKNNIKKEIVKHKALANLYDKNNYHLKY